MKETSVLFTELGNLGLITLNRPQALNALTHEMILALSEQLTVWEKDPDVKAVLIQGAGEKAFCAGGDIRQVYEARHDSKLPMKQFFWDEYRLNAQIFHYPKPYIALLDGITMGGGVGVSIHGKYRIATERFVFAMPETGIGFFPDVGGSYFLPRCPGQTGIYLGLTGAKISIADASYLNLVNHFVPMDKMPEVIDEIAMSNLGDLSQKHIDEIIDSVNIYSGDPTLANVRKDIDCCFNFDTVEEILTALHARKNEWCDKTAKLLASKSPTSLKVTLQQLRKGHHLSFDECMRMEYRMVVRFLQGHDFYEGVRAVIIDKDQSPKWQPSELSEVSAQNVDHYFAPLQNESELKFIHE